MTWSCSPNSSRNISNSLANTSGLVKSARARGFQRRSGNGALTGIVISQGKAPLSETSVSNLSTFSPLSARFGCSSLVTLACAVGSIRRRANARNEEGNKRKEKKRKERKKENEKEAERERERERERRRHDPGASEGNTDERNKARRREKARGRREEGPFEERVG